MWLKICCLRAVNGNSRKPNLKINLYNSSDAYTISQQMGRHDFPKRFFQTIQREPNITHMTSLIIQVEIHVHSTIMTNTDYAAQ